MNRTYEWMFRLQDLVSPTLMRISQRYSGTVSRMASMTSRFTSMFKGATQSVEELRRKLDGLKGRRDLLVDTRQIKAANREIDALEKKMNKLQGLGGARGEDRKQGGLLSRLAPYVGAAGILAGAGSLAHMGMDREQTKVAYRQFLGNDTDKRMGELNQFANVTPYTNEEVYAGGRNLLSSKVSGSELIGKMTNIGNMAAASQKDFTELTGAYAKIKAKGFVDSGELHQEFGGTQLMEQLKKNLGVNGEELFKRAEKRQIKFEDLDKAIADLSAKGGAYEGALDKLSATAGGKWSTFLGSLQDKFATWAEKLNPILGKAFDFGTDLISKIDPILAKLQPVFDAVVSGVMKVYEATAPFRDLLAELWTWAGQLWNQFVGLTGGTDGLRVVFEILAAVVWTISTALKYVGELAMWLAGSTFVQLVAIIWGAVTAWSFLNAVMIANPIGAVIVGIMALVAGIKYAWDNIDGFRNAILRMWEVAKSVFSSLGTILKALIMPTPENIAAAFAAAKGGLGITQGLANGDKAVKQDEQARKVAAEQARLKPVTPNVPAAPATPKAGGLVVPKPGDKPKKEKASTGKAGGVDATTGGTKSTSIVINLKSLVEKLSINAGGVQDGMQDMESQLTDHLLRVLNSANSIGT